MATCIQCGLGLSKKSLSVFCTASCRSEWTERIEGPKRQKNVKRQGVTATHIASIIGLTYKQVRVLISRGMPTLTPEPHARFDVEQSIAWWEANKCRWLTKSGCIRKRTIRTMGGEPAIKPGVVYAIIDRRSDRVHYIGQATNFRERANQHLARLRTGRHQNHHLQKWFANSKAAIEDLKVEVIETCDPDTIGHCERLLISYGRAAGWPLKNINDGGDRPPRFTKRIRKRLSEASKARWNDPAYRERWALATGCGLRKAYGTPP